MRMLVVLVLAGAISGCTLLPELHLGAGLSAVIPDDGSLENTYQLDIIAQLCMANIQLEAAYGDKTYDYKLDDGVGGFVEGELEAHPLAIVLKYVKSAGFIKVTMGGGVVFESVDETTSDLNYEDAEIYRATVGVEIEPTDKLFITVDLMYDYSQDAIKSLLTSEEVETSGLMARVGFVFHF